ncbi:MAG: hypothetical protein KGI54_13130 [Pseudomonadota bacterium]|nr:hypothetical protein [Pseudomonadota bacterium]
MNTRIVRRFLNKLRREHGKEIDSYPFVVLVNGREYPIKSIAFTYGSSDRDYANPVVKIEIDY